MRLTRRGVLRYGLGGAGALLLAACSTAAPTAAPPKPTAAPPKPAEPAAKPAEAAKPTEAPKQVDTVKPAVPEPTKPAAAAQSAAAPAAAKPASGAAPSGKIVFMNGIGGQQKLTETWAAEFSKNNAGATVEGQWVAQDFNTKLQTLVAGGTPPDVFTFYQENIPIVAAVERNLLFPLDDLIRDDKYDIESFLPQAVNLNKWKGKTYAIPRDYGNQQVYYNLDLFEKAKLPMPATSWTDTTWTYDKFVEAAKAITNPGERVWGNIVNVAWRPWASFIYSNGGAVVKTDQEGLATEFAIADDAAVEGLQFLQDLIHKHKVAPGPEATSDMGPVDLFGTGKVGMLIGNPSQAAAFRRFDKIKWDVAPLPVGRGGKRGTGGGGTAWAMAQATKNQPLAWSFLKYISSEKGQHDEVAIGATTPSRKAVVESKEFLSPEKPPKNSKSYAEAQGYVVRDPVHAKWPEVQAQIVNKNVELLWGNKADARTVAKTIKEQGDARFKS